MEKVIVVGSGPAGLTAAIYTSRALLNPLCIEGEEAGGQLMLTTDVDNYPGFEKGIMGPELMQVMRAQAERFGTRFLTKNVTKVDFSGPPFKVWVGKEVFESESIIVSTGASARYIGLDSEAQFLGKGVSTCATCDGAFYKDLPVCVVGGGDSAMEEALFLTRFASRVYIIHRRDRFRASKIMADKVLKHEKIEVLWNSMLEEVLGEKLVQKVRIKSAKNGETSELAVEGVFIAIGHIPNTQIFSGQIELEENAYVKVKAGRSFTSVDGVFACGDVQDFTYRQAVTAAGSGCMAAIDCEKWLEARD